MLRKLNDTFWLIAGIIWGLAMIANLASAQEFNDESFEARLDRATAEVLGKLNQRVTAVEKKADQFDQAVADIREILTRMQERVVTLEESRTSSPVPSVATASPAKTQPVVAPAQRTITQSVRVRRSQSELDRWVRSNYTPRTGIRTGVSPPSAVWRHLQDGNHSFSAAQVNGLEFWVAYALHDAHHRGRISPWKTETQTVVTTSTASAKTAQPAKVQRSYTVQRSVGCANGGCARQFSLQATNVKVGPVRRLFRGW